MFKNILKILLFFTLSFASTIYTIPIQKEKSPQIQKAVKLYQYQYDLKQLNDILKILYFDNNFKESSETAELNVKNIKSKYSFEYIKSLLKILNGINPYDDRIIGYYNSQTDIGGGYIKDIKDKFNENYQMYLGNYPINEVINKNFNIIKNNIIYNLQKLKINLKKEKNIRPYLKKIFQNLIIALDEIQNETNELKKLGVIKVFTNQEDKKYLIPKNWAQTDGNTTLANIINFILNGNRRYNFYGIKYYYNKVYQDDTKPFVITH